MSTNTSTRYTWLDMARVFAACLIVMIHTATDHKGTPFADAQTLQRIGPVLSRLMGELASTELFILISAFVAAVSLARKPKALGVFTKQNAKRLLKPFAFWTVFYLLFSLWKAWNFGYFDYAMAQVSDPITWVRGFLFGTSKYQMHFLPTMFLIFLFMPVMMLAYRYWWLGVLLLPLLIIRNQVDIFLYSNLSDTVFLRDLLVRINKVLCYTGYGFFACAAASIIAHLSKSEKWRAESKTWLGFFLLLAALILVCKGTYGYEAVKAGSWLYRKGIYYYAHYLTPVVFIGLFFCLGRFKLSPIWSELSLYSFGLYLLHPVWIDVFDVLFYQAIENPSLYVVAKYGFVLPLTFATAFLIRLTPLAWTIGLTRKPVSSQGMSFSKSMNVNSIKTMT